MHRLLCNQLARARSASGGVDLDSLCALVSDAYAQFEKDRARSDRATRLMVAEVNDLNRERNAALEALAVQNSQLDAALENMAHALAMFNAGGQLTICNRHFRELFHLPPDTKSCCEEVRAAMAAMLATDGGHQQRVLEQICHGLAEGKPAETTLLLADGRAVLSTFQPLEGGGWVQIHRDISELRAHEEELRTQNARFEGAIENMVHGLSMFDGEHRLVVANRHFAEMYGLPEHIVVPGAHVLDLVAHGARRGIFKDASVIDAAPATIEAIARHETLDRLWYLANGRVIAFTITRLAGGGWVAVHRDVTEARHAERRLADSEQRFRDFATAASDWCWETDEEHRYAYLTPAFQSVTGIDPQALLGRHRTEFPVHEEDRAAIDAHRKDLDAHKPFQDLLYRKRKPDGTFVWIRASGSPRFDRKGRFLGYRGTGKDVSIEEERKQALRRAEVLLKSRSDQLVEAQRMGKLGDWTYRLGEPVLWWAPETYDLLRYDPATFRTTRDAIMSSFMGDGAQRVLESQASVMRSATVESVDVKVRRGDGSIGDFVLTSKALPDAFGNIVGFVGTIQDISERKLAEEQLEKLAYFDPLTGLANRALFRREIRDVLGRCHRTASAGALLLLDLDRFKEVNDSLGHVAGDQLLTKVAHLIGRVLGPDDFFARLGGDEFAIVVRECADQAAIEALAARVVEAVSRPIMLDRGEVVVGASIGIALIPRDGDNAEELLRNADLALYRAKEDGRGRFTLFRPDMNEVVQYKISLARDLRRAIADNAGLEVHYQPQVEIASGRVVGYEALMRWRHATRGYIPPAEFIPIAESSRLICDLGVWILRQAARQAKAWLDAGEPARMVAVNVSAAQIWHTDLERDVAGVLAETGLPANLLCLELTESLLADHAEGRVRSVLTALKRLGVTLALDDFGTDYSSLGYLIQLPFDKLKIDRIFVHGIAGSTRSRELLKGIIALGRGLGMTVVAEGAEKPEEAAILREFGCDLVQGYVYARPAPAPEALAAARALDDRAHGEDMLVSAPAAATSLAPGVQSVAA